MNIETKNIIDWIVNKLMKIISLGQFKPKVDEFITTEYRKGMEKTEKQLDMNLIPQDEDIKFLNNYVFDNMTQHTDQVGEDLRQELSRGIMNKESIAKIKTRVRNVFKDKKHLNRLKAVVRTEQVRANNKGAYDGATQSGLKLKKYLDVTIDGVTSQICLAEHRKYGSKENAIALDKEFIVKVDNKTYRAQYPPFHPNCRTVVKFVRVD